MKYLYTIKNNHGGEIGAWPTLEEARAGAKDLGRFSKFNFIPVRRIAKECPSCGKFDTKSNIEALGVCTGCDDRISDYGE